jgi:phosphoserine phosphatase RsbU/P
VKKIWFRILPYISPGIRLKLTVFTLFFVSTLLIFSFVFGYLRQKEDLSESFNREIQAPLAFVSGFVGELHKISDGLVQLETFRIRLRQKTEEARRYRGTYYVKQKSVGKDILKFFGGDVKYEYQARSYDTYYSTYLTDKNLKDFEEQLQNFVNVTMNNSATAGDFANWKAIAREIAAADLRIAKGEKTGWLVKYAVTMRARLMQYLRKPFTPVFSSRLERTGFRPEQIQIISYDTQESDLLDTASFFGLSGSASKRLFRNEAFKAFKTAFFKNPKLLFAQKEFNAQQTPFDTQFSPVFTNIPVVERARKVAGIIVDNASIFSDFAAIDGQYAAELQVVAAKKRERMKALRQKAIPPYRDPEFMDLTREYRGIADKRNAELSKLAKFDEKEKVHFDTIQKQIKTLDGQITDYKKILKKLELDLKLAKSAKPPEGSLSPEEIETKIEAQRQLIESAESDRNSSKAHETSISDNPELIALEALLHLRDAALLSKLKLSLISEQDVLSQEYRNAGMRRTQQRSYGIVRDFIYAGQNETEIKVPYGAVSPLAGGVLAITRSEAEDYMYLLDTAPLLGTEGLGAKLLNENVVGFNLAIINKTEGLKRIISSTRWLVIFSSGIALLAIFAAWYFSGFAVRRIQSLSTTSAAVRDGNLNVAFDGRGYDELATLGQSLTSMVHGLKEREELKGELMAAEEIQKRLLPMAVPQNLAGRADIAGFYKAMVGIGGDYFDYLALGKDLIAIAMGDVSNHGVGPALVMAMARSQLHGLLREKEISIKNILLKLNEQLYIETPANIFVTFWLALYNLKTGELQYISAGHSKPLLLSAKTGKTQYLEAGGMPLGMDENDFFATTLEMHKMTLEKGDIFLQYTDGLSEAMNPDREQFGYERMETALKSVATENAEKILLELSHEVERFSETKLDQPGPSELSDDIALVCLRRT